MDDGNGVVYALERADLMKVYVGQSIRPKARAREHWSVNRAGLWDDGEPELKLLSEHPVGEPLRIAEADAASAYESDGWDVRGRGGWYSPSKATREALSRRAKGNQNAKGKHWTLRDETRKLQGEALTKRVVKSETREKLRLANLGKKASAKTRAKMSAERKGRPLKSQRGNHTRWHVNRNKPNPDCPFCVSDSDS